MTDTKSARRPRRDPNGRLATIGDLTGTALASSPAHHPSSSGPDLGANVTVFDPSPPVSQIQATLDAAYTQQVGNEMGTARYAFLFKPGTYGTDTQPLQVKVGYYTEIAGLGASPTDVVINGKVEVYNQCLADGGTSNCLALTNFWRSLSNLSIHINAAGQDGCRSTADFWAVSQAAPMRRVQINGGLSLMDFCSDGPQYASGGFISDSAISGTTINGSQQQFLVRNSSLNGWSNGVWNQVFAGTVGAPPQSFPTPPYTTLDTTPVSKERPYLYVDAAGKWNVFVPSVARNSSGTTWANGSTPGRSLPLSSFYLAKPGDSVAKINLALLLGKNLLLTPGVYDVPGTILVSHPNQVVLGLGLATLTAQRGSTPLKIRPATTDLWASRPSSSWPRPPATASIAALTDRELPAVEKNAWSAPTASATGRSLRTSSATPFPGPRPG